ncbi:hypothetical protein Tdes44962_MAKER05448 [Teratosphaeria destructans]|uniref:Uncharacterized protein n=1 Tax=Teratosphaeria destructans TaxID=418781 RepID=A0A9W7SJZ3_9PEZI|nr:hypothetical protein Tdes44962_MAKER05448 [Teratosphaeria destructans]
MLPSDWSRRDVMVELAAKGLAVGPHVVDSRVIMVIPSRFDDEDGDVGIFCQATSYCEARET